MRLYVYVKKKYAFTCKMYVTVSFQYKTIHLSIYNKDMTINF